MRIPAVTVFAPVKLLAPERIRVLPPVLVKPPAPLMGPLQVRFQVASSMALAFRVIAPVHEAPQPLLLNSVPPLSVSGFDAETRSNSMVPLIRVTAPEPIGFEKSGLTPAMIAPR